MPTVVQHHTTNEQTLTPHSRVCTISNVCQREMLGGNKETLPLLLLARCGRDNIISTFHLALRFPSEDRQHSFHRRETPVWFVSTGSAVAVATQRILCHRATWSR